MTTPRGSGRGTKPVAIDLFSGVGGLSLGFEQAGFDVALAADNDRLAVETYRRNFPGRKVRRLNLARARGTEILAAANVATRPDVLVGGPPCQGFSVGGRRDMADPRNQLLLTFARLVNEIRPRYFVLENVFGLLLGDAQRLVDLFEEAVQGAGYRVVRPIQVLEATHFGVPQRRRRVFILGYEEGEAPPKYPERRAEPPPSVRDAIADLPDVCRLPHLRRSDVYVGPLGPPAEYARTLRAFRTDVEDRAAPRRRRPGALTGCLTTSHDPAIRRRFLKTEPGAQDPISRYFRLSWDGVAPTLRAGTGYDHGRHTAPRPIHPSAPRCITAREAARLHSFPDWFQFHPTRWHAFGQIGNSVPPRLARAVARAILDCLGAACPTTAPRHGRSRRAAAATFFSPGG